METTQIVPNKTGTFADTLEAIGIATLFLELGYAPVEIRRGRGTWEVTARNGPQLDLWPRPLPGFPYVWLAENEEGKTRPPMDQLDYNAERERSNRWTAWRKQAKEKTAQREAREAAGVGEPDPPHPHFQTAFVLASMRSTWWSDLTLARWICDRPEEALRWAKHGLRLGDGAPQGLPKVTNSQILNPVGGKGVHAPKTELRKPGPLPTQLVDPFAEWMKIRGLWTAMLPYKAGDIFKLFVIEPRQIEVEYLGRVHHELQSLKLWGGVRLDIDSTLRCSQVLIRHSDAYQDEKGPIPLLGKTPREVIAGLRLACFKSLGKGAALMNDSLLPLPDWFAIETPEDAEAYMAVIDEAIGSRTPGEKTGGCLNSLREVHSGDGAILQQYRSWLLGGQLDQLLEFHSQFAVHLMARWGAKKWARAFTTRGLDILLIRGYDMSANTKEIVTDPGFLSVARAIRNCTISALQMRRRERGGKGREVHFGLAQKWKQKIKSGKEDLLAAIAEFVQEQNWEIVHRLDGRGHVVRSEDLDSLFDLIDRRGAELVGSLLLAYGYARAPKVATEAEEEETPTHNPEGEQS